MIRNYAGYIALVLLAVLAFQAFVLWRDARNTLTGRTVWPFIRQYARDEVVLIGHVALCNVIIAAIVAVLFFLR
jgi:hypothetical protein